jgi:hypothetical protein
MTNSIDRAQRILNSGQHNVISVHERWSNCETFEYNEYQAIFKHWLYIWPGYYDQFFTKKTVIIGVHKLSISIMVKLCIKLPVQRVNIAFHKNTQKAKDTPTKSFDWSLIKPYTRYMMQINWRTYSMTCFISAHVLH